MSIISQNILEHYKYPKNKKEMGNPDAVAESVNRSCWDSVKMFVKFEKDKKTIKEISFVWNWCSVSIACASMLTEELIWESVANIDKIELNDIEEMLWIKIWANRIKCATLALNTIKEAINKQ